MITKEEEDKYYKECELINTAIEEGDIKSFHEFANRNDMRRMPHQDFYENACKYGRLEICRYFDSFIERVDLSFCGHVACYNNHKHILNYLIEEKGFNDFSYALNGALSNGHIELAKTFIDKVDKFDTGLCGAVYNCNLENMKWMISLGANNYYDALEVAFLNKNREIINFLMAKCSKEQIKVAFLNQIKSINHIENYQLMIENNLCNIRELIDEFSSSENYNFSILPYLLDEANKQFIIIDLDNLLKNYIYNLYCNTEIIVYLLNKGANSRIIKEYYLSNKKNILRYMINERFCRELLKFGLYRYKIPNIPYMAKVLIRYDKKRYKILREIAQIYLIDLSKLILDYVL